MVHIVKVVVRAVYEGLCVGLMKKSGGGWAGVAAAVAWRGSTASLCLLPESFETRRTTKRQTGDRRSVPTHDSSLNLGTFLSQFVGLFPWGRR